MYPFFRSRLLLALCLLTSANAWGASPFFNVLDYGAHNDGSVSSTEAIRSAIQAAKVVGGGTVYFPPGNYVTGPIELVNNLVLYIDAGATLRFPATRLPFTNGREQGIECLTPVPLIGGRNLQNVTITGRGVLTTDNAEWLKVMPRTLASKIRPGVRVWPELGTPSTRSRGEDARAGRRLPEGGAGTPAVLRPHDGQHQRSHRGDSLCGFIDVDDPSPVFG